MRPWTSWLAVSKEAIIPICAQSAQEEQAYEQAEPPRKGVVAQKDAPVTGGDGEFLERRERGQGGDRLRPTEG